MLDLDMLEIIKQDETEESPLMQILLSKLMAQMIAFKMIEDGVELVPLEGSDLPVITSDRREEIIH